MAGKRAEMTFMIRTGQPVTVPTLDDAQDLIIFATERGVDCYGYQRSGNWVVGPKTDIDKETYPK